MQQDGQLRYEVAFWERLAVPFDVSMAFHRPWIEKLNPEMAAALGADIPFNNLGFSSGVHLYRKAFDDGFYVGLQGCLDRYKASMWETGAKADVRWWTLSAAPKLGWKWVRDSGLTVAFDIGAGGRTALGASPAGRKGVKEINAPLMLTGGLWLGGTL